MSARSTTARGWDSGGRDPADERAFLLYYARVMLNQARARRARHPAFARELLTWAGRARRDAAAVNVRPAQGMLL